MKRLLLLILLLIAPLPVAAQNISILSNPCTSVACTAISSTGVDFSVNNPLFVPAGQFTGQTQPLGVSFWVKPAVSISQGFLDFVNNRGSSANQTGWEAYWRTITDPFFLKFGLPALTSPTACSPSGMLCARNTLINLPTNTWHNVCIGYSTSVDFMAVDGYVWDRRSTGSSYSPNTSYLEVGQAFNPQIAMRDIRIRSGSTFSPLDCMQLYTAGINNQMPTGGPLATSLYAWWPMNDCTGGPPVTTCPDHSGHSPARDLIADAAPVVAITSPSSSPVTGNVTLEATCTDIISCNSVTWTVDGVGVGSSTTAPFTVIWNSATVTDRPHAIVASATNAGGATGTGSATVTSANSIAAISWFFSPVGVHGNTCQSALQACPITDQFAAPGTRRYVEDDTINFDAGNGAFNITTSRIFLDASSNVYPAGNGHPIIIQSYGGTGSCIPLAGQLGKCAKLQLDPSSALTQMTFLNGTTNVVQRNLQLVGGTTPAYTGTSGTAAGIQWFNNLNGSNVTLTNNQIQDWANDTYIHAFTGTLAVTETNNFLTGTTVNSQGTQAAYFEGHNTGVFQSNVCSNIGGPTPNPPDIGGGTCFIHNRQLSISPVQFVTIEDNVQHDSFANWSNCGGPFSYWGVNNGYLHFLMNESYNNIGLGGCDQGMYDADLSSSHNVMELGYAHHNFGACVIFFNAIQDAGVPWVSNTARYNICESSTQSTGVTGLGPGGFSQTGMDSYVYGNSVYSNAPNALHVGGLCGGGVARSSPIDSVWANNVCVTQNAGPTSVLFGFTTDSLVVPPAAYTMLTNDYYNVGGGTKVFLYSGSPVGGATLAQFQSSFPGKEAGSILTNPLLTSVGGNVQCYSGTGVPTGPQPCPTGYVLTGPTSPVIGTGTNPASFGASGLAIATQDYFLNAVPNGTGSGWNMGSDGAHH